MTLRLFVSLYSYVLIWYSFYNVFNDAAPLSWRREETDTTPGARQDGLMIYHPQLERAYLFGGRSKNGGSLQDTWELRSINNVWTWSSLNFTSSQSPPSRFSFVGGLYRTELQSYFVIATGDAGGTRFNDVYALQLDATSISNGWFKVKTDGDIPSPRYGSVGGVIPDGNKLLISHGFDKNRYSDSFELDLSRLSEDQSATWKKIYDGTTEYNPSAPHARCLGAGTVTKNSEIVLFGGCLTGGGTGGPCPSNDAWIFQSGEWTRADNKPAANWYSRMIPLQDNENVLMYGGRDTSNQVITISKTQDKEINVLNTKNREWTRYVISGDVPQKRENPHIIFIDNWTMLLWGGIHTSGRDFNTDIFIMSGSPDETATNDDARPWFTLWMLHGIFMFLGWGCALQYGAFIARYFRHKDPFWFICHRAMQSIGLLIAIIGTILGFISASTVASRHLTFAHSIIGIIIMIIGVAQPINAYYRPHHGEKYRSIWELFHKNLGRIALILAFVNISLGLMMAVVINIVWIFWFIYLGIFVVVYIIAEIFLKKKAKKEDDNSYHETN